MSKIVRNDGIYTTNILSRKNHPYNFIYIGIFFIQDYMCFEWEPVTDPVIVNSEFLKHMVSWREDIYSAIVSSEINSSEVKFKFAKFNEKPNGYVEARFRDSEESLAYKDVRLSSGLLGWVSFTLDTYAMNYDLFNHQNSGYKEKRLVEYERLKFNKY